MSSCQKFKLFNTKYKQCDALEFKKVKKTKSRDERLYGPREKSKHLQHIHVVVEGGPIFIYPTKEKRKFWKKSNLFLYIVSF